MKRLKCLVSLGSLDIPASQPYSLPFDADFVFGVNDAVVESHLLASGAVEWLDAPPIEAAGGEGNEGNEATSVPTIHPPHPQGQVAD